MSAFDRKHRAGDDSADIHQVLAGLGEAPAAPDLSQSIMGRLGYQRVSAQVARRRRLQSWANRAGILMVAAIAFAIGWRVFEASPQVRRPAETTVPEAIHHDVQMQQQRLEGAIRGIRNISIPKFAPGASQRDNRSPSAPSQELEDDVNRSTMAPVRWV